MNLEPWIVALVILIVWMIIVLGGEALQAGGATSLEGMVSKISYSLIAAPIFLLAAVAYTGWWREVGLQLGDSINKLAVLLLPALAIIIVWVVAVRRGLPERRTFRLDGLNTLLIGFSEELMFRGFVFYGSESVVGSKWAVVTTALIFGLSHSLNGLITGNWQRAIEQAGVNVVSGFWMTALRAYLGSIIPLIVIHWLWDFGVFAATSGKGKSVRSVSIANVLPLASEIILFGYALWLLYG